MTCQHTAKQLCTCRKEKMWLKPPPPADVIQSLAEEWCKHVSTNLCSKYLIDFWLLSMLLRGTKLSDMMEHYARLFFSGIQGGFNFLMCPLSLKLYVHILKWSAWISSTLTMHYGKTWSGTDVSSWEELTDLTWPHSLITLWLFCSYYDLCIIFFFSSLLKCL